MKRFHGCPHRTALSLLEVLLALSILATAAMMLSQLMHLTLRSAAIARDEPRAILWCENRLEEIACGILAPTSVQDMPVPEDNAWTYSIDAQPAPFNGLLEVRVQVKAAGSSAANPAVSMTRWVVDPSDPRFQPSSDSEDTATESDAELTDRVLSATLRSST